MKIIAHPERITEDGKRYLDTSRYVCTWLEHSNTKVGIFTTDELEPQ